MKKSIFIIVLFVLIYTTNSLASGGFCQEYRQSDKKLNAAYQNIMNSKKLSNEAKKKIKTAQRAWLKYRDAHLEAIFPKEDIQLAYGTSYTSCSCAIKLDLTNDRIKELDTWVNGVEEGDTCSGSRFFR